MNLSEEQVLALAPDEAAKKAGKELANLAKWSGMGRTDAALWGLCQGSGSKPYHTQVDLTNIAFKCSCPSRKFPCKHGLGILLLYVRHTAAFTETAVPAWVSDWLGKRSERQEKKADNKPVDEVAQAKRQQARKQKVDDGVAELLRWVKDLVRTGLLQMPEKGREAAEGMARRMIDAQAPGLAGLLRELGEINYFREDWPSQCLHQLSRIYLLAKGYQQSETLSPGLLQDVRSLVGFPQSQEEIKVQPGITDYWFVLGKEVEQQEQLTVERNWLYGMQTGNHALVLQFYVGAQMPAFTVMPGTCVHAALVYYPSVLPMRALVKQTFGTSLQAQVQALPHWQQVAELQTTYTAQQPFVTEYPFVVQNLRAVTHNGQWWLEDEQQQRMSLAATGTALWKMLAISGGKPLQAAVIGKGHQYRLLGVWHRNEYKLL